MKEYGHEHKTIHNYGFFFTPKHSVHDQAYHVDYLEEMENIFIPLAPLTAKNSTRYMTTYAKSKPSFGKYETCRYANDDLELLEKEGTDSIELAQVICR